ncbi:hypothetical protein FGG08_005782 [Glutinoglossum americanum]|uniref:5'-3' DNA helicase ZGRF1-like N-terminal domain-containing protein n=1 Tax=Glutinoglossum americanum TaxID=1670608 RepID=A0A9P8L134_9PEZI|nr:hypothetical protein FGG08_005782 [Glutinoglossum americanum]
MSTFQRSSAITLPPSLPLTQNTAPAKEFKCLYTHDKRQKKKRWHDGYLRFHTFNKRVMAYDDARNFIGDMHYTDSGEICEGDDLVFEAFLVQVLEYTKTLQQDLTPLFAPKLRRRETIHEETSAGVGRTPTVRTSAQLRLCQSRGLPQMITPQTPLSQLKAKSLNALLGTAKGPHGRALLPAISPFEERQQKLDYTRVEGPPTKRQKRSVPIAKAGDNDMDSHIALAAPVQTGQAEVRERLPLHRGTSRQEQQNGGKEVLSEGFKRPTSRTKEAYQKPQPPRSPNSSESVLQESRRRIQSLPISIESDSEPTEGPCRLTTGRGRKDPTKSLRARKGKTPPLYEKYPLQPLRILTAHSSRKTKLLCQEAPPRPPEDEIGSRARSSRQQQAGLQDRMEKLHCTRTTPDISRLAQSGDRPDIAQWTNDNSRQAERGNSTSLRSSPQASWKKRGGVGRASPPLGHERTNRQPSAVDKASSRPEFPKGESHSNSREIVGQPARSRQERHRLPEQSSKFRQSVSHMPKFAANAPPTFNGGHSAVVEESPEDPWSKESVDLFDWRPPPMMEKAV